MLLPSHCPFSTLIWCHTDWRGAYHRRKSKMKRKRSRTGDADTFLKRTKDGRGENERTCKNSSAFIQISVSSTFTEKHGGRTETEILLFQGTSCKRALKTASSLPPTLLFSTTSCKGTCCGKQSQEEPHYSAMCVCVCTCVFGQMSC